MDYCWTAGTLGFHHATTRTASDFIDHIDVPVCSYLRFVEHRKLKTMLDWDALKPLKGQMPLLGLARRLKQVLQWGSRLDIRVNTKFRQLVSSKCQGLSA